MGGEAFIGRERSSEGEVFWEGTGPGTKQHHGRIEREKEGKNEPQTFAEERR